MTVEEMRERIVVLEEETMTLEEQIRNLESTTHHLDNTNELTLHVDRTTTDIIPKLLTAISGRNIENNIAPVLTNTGPMQTTNRQNTLNETESQISHMKLRVQYNREEIRNLKQMMA